MARRRILLIDDEAALLRMIAAYLTRLEYEVHSCRDTGEAWAKIEADPAFFDAVLLDMSMPGLPAEELALRILQGDSRVAVIASSGYPTDLTKLEEAAPGRVIFLHKPYSPEMLADCIRRVTEQ